LTEPVIGAAVDVGSNSIHLLVARIRRSGLHVLLDESELLGLGELVDGSGALTPAVQRTVVATLRRYVDAARRAGAGRISLVATEPLRRSANAAGVAAAVRDKIGLPLHVLTEQQEAELTFLGVSGGSVPTKALLVIDIGGGSSEFAASTPARGIRAVSLPIGSARLSAAVVQHDPPTKAEIAQLRARAAELIGHLPAGVPARAVFVGGTATNLTRLAPLTMDGLATAWRVLARQPADELIARYGVRPRRARQLAAGAALIEAAFLHYRLAAAETSPASLREGAILAAHRFGDDWPAAVAALLAR
jgi:exopolyphosphatase/pppGpp-phosphohydrolase